MPWVVALDCVDRADSGVAEARAADPTVAAVEPVPFVTVVTIAGSPAQTPMIASDLAKNAFRVPTFSVLDHDLANARGTYVAPSRVRLPKGNGHMMDKLSASVLDSLGSSGIGSLSQLVGADRSSTERSISLALPTMVSGMLSHVSGANGAAGATKLFELVKETAPAIGDPRGLIASLGVPTSARGLVDRGGSIVHAVFGSRQAAVVDALGAQAGVKPAVASSILRFGGSALVGTLGSVIAKRNLDARSFGQMLLAEQASISTALPAQLLALTSSVRGERVIEAVDVSKDYVETFAARDRPIVVPPITEAPIVPASAMAPPVVTVATKAPIAPASAPRPAVRNEPPRAVVRDEPDRRGWIIPAALLGLVAFAGGYALLRNRQDVAREPVASTAYDRPALQEPMPARQPAARELPPPIVAPIVAPARGGGPAGGGSGTPAAPRDIGPLRFESATTDLTTNGRAKFEEIVGALQARPTAHVRLVGHIDGVGSPEFNRRLSEQRSTQIRSMLLSRGIAANRVEQTAGHADTHSVSSTDVFIFEP